MKGVLDVWQKLAAPAPTSAIVKGSPLLSASASTAPDPMAQARMAPPTDPETIKRTFSLHEQGRTRLEPPKKVAEDQRLCTSCRKERHYGPCAKPYKSKPAGSPLKEADFNLGLRGDDPHFVGGGNDGGPSTSPNYHSATSDSSLARARGGRPADEQAATGFADLFRHLGINSVASEPGQMTGGLLKQSYEPSSAIHSMSENRGPTSNIYEQLLTPSKAPIVGWGDEGPQRIDRAFGQIDNVADSTCIEGGSAPAGGPAVLG